MPEWTKEQRDAISAKGDILVSAAAGSGKTAVLAERVMRHVTGADINGNSIPVIDIDRFLIVTFTHAAADEMRRRIGNELQKAIAAHPGNAALRRQQILLGRAAISTIDSFCGDLVRAHFSELNIPSSFAVQGDDDLAALSRTVLENLIDRQFEKTGEELEKFLRLLDYLNPDNGIYTLTRTMESLHKKIMTLPFYEDFFEMSSGLCGQPTDSSIWTGIILGHYRSRFVRLVGYATTLQENLPDEKMTKKFGQAIKACLDFARSVTDCAEKRNLNEFKALCANPPKLPAKQNKPEYAEFNMYLDGTRTLINGILKDWKADISLDTELQEKLSKDLKFTIDGLFELIMQYESDLLAEKTAQRRYSFNDIERMALSLMVNRKENEYALTPLGEEIGANYKMVLVDEYQDVNDLQDMLFWALSGMGVRLFAVGDVKQCIYRFRQANPENFLRKKRTRNLYDGSSTAPSTVLLSNNFRSRPEICEFVNDMFSLLCSEEAGGVEYGAEERLSPMARYDECDGPAVEMHFLRASDKAARQKEALKILQPPYDLYALSQSADSTKLQEPQYIAELIIERLKTLNIYENGERRPARPGDFAVLAGTRAILGDVHNALNEAGIPAAYDSESNLFKNRAAVILLSLMRAASNPLDDVALAAALTSPMYGFTSDDIAAVRLRGKQDGIPRGQSFYSALLLCAEWPKTARFLKDLHSFGLAAASMPLDELIDIISTESGLSILVCGMDDECAAAIKSLRKTAIEYSAFGGDLAAFLRYIDHIKEERGELNITSRQGSSNAVRLMTIHGSKGLQFPVCILADCAHKFNNSDIRSQLIINEKHGIGLKIYGTKPAAKYQTVAHRALSLTEQRELRSEQLRLLYVAMTRAKERLYFVSIHNDPAKAAAKWLPDCTSGGATKNSVVSTTECGDFAGNTLPAETVVSAASYADWLMLYALSTPNANTLLADGGCTSNAAGFYLKTVSPEDIPAKTDNQPKDEPPADSDLLEKLRKRVNFSYPYTLLNTLPAKTSVSALNERTNDQSFQFTGRPAFLSAKGLTPAERGTAMHSLMQYADFAACAQSPHEEIERLVDNQFITQAEADSIDMSELTSFFRSELYQKRMTAAERILREVRFMFEWPAERILGYDAPCAKDEFVLVQGIADCVIFEPDGLVVVDYKTDRVKSAAELAGKYREQLRYYAEALYTMYGRAVKQCLLYSFDLKETVEVVF